ncbi:MAG: AMP-binding protein [Bacteroidia bacterium]|nr:AMP-binding protein [Bacteroidia bacterium]
MRTLTELFEFSVEKYLNNPLLWEKPKDRYLPSTYLDIRQQVYSFGAGLMSLGLKKEDRVGLLSEGRNNWLVSELGIFYCGAVNVPLSVKLEATELKFRLVHSGSRMVIASAGQASKIAEIINDLPDIDYIIHFDPIENPGSKDLFFEDIQARGRDFLNSEENKKQFEAVWKNVQPNDIANISYTSGTTADPKGIMLTHLNYTANVLQANAVLDIAENYKTLAILPWDHSFAHTACLYAFMFKGASIGSVQSGRTPMETLRNVPVNIKEFMPDIMMSVPALSKSFRKNIEKGILSKGKITEMLFNHGLKVAYLYNGNGWNRGKGWRVLLKPEYAFFDKILFSKIREGFGGNLKFFIGGGALLDIELQRFFYAIGTPVYQGYGLTEAAPIISANSPLSVKFGSSGKPVKDLEIKICDVEGVAFPVGEKGEIVVKGENVMKGYWKNPKASEETLKKGWLHTGDLGYLSNDGYLYVLGRFKSLLIGNDGSKLGLNPDSDEGINKSLEIIKQEIDAYRKGGKFEGLFPERWLPTAIQILPEAFTEQNHLLNSTLKMVRGKITEHFKLEMNFIYTPEAKEITNIKNKESIKKWNK